MNYIGLLAEIDNQKRSASMMNEEICKAACLVVIYGQQAVCRQ